MKNIYLKILFGFGVLTSIASCRDSFNDTKFFTSKAVGDANAVTSMDELHSFTLGAHADLRSTYYYGRDFILYGEIRSDEMYSRGSSGYYVDYRNFMTMTSTSSYATNTWNQMYAAVREANIVIGTDLNSLKWSGSNNQNDVKNKASYYIGQAYGIRALVFFDLLRLYGQTFLPAGAGGTGLGVILPTTYSPKNQEPRKTVAETEAQIEHDFDSALSNMNNYASNPVDGAGENFSDKTVLNTLSVKALMCRYYLYKKNYAKVRSLVADIVASGQYTVAPAGSLKSYFSSKYNGIAPNSMFELNVGSVNGFGYDGIWAMYSADGYNNTPVLNSVYSSTYSANDVRKTDLLSVGDDNRVHVTGKYYNQNGEDNIRMVRYEEVLLDGVEAELNGGNPATALIYYNQIRQNRNLAASSTVDMAALRAERTRELIGEGFRYWDLLRWGLKIPGRSTTGALSSAFDLNIPSGSTPTADAQNQHIIFPIPSSEANGNPNVKGQQNPGYSF